MSRLDKARQSMLEPKRINHAVSKITALGYSIEKRSSVHIEFSFNGNTVQFYPYSGWFSGKSIGSGRGLENLIEKLETT